MEIKVYITKEEIEALRWERLDAEADYCEPGYIEITGWLEFANAVLALNEVRREKLQSNS